MNILANTLIAVIGLFHCSILYLEMFLWDSPKGMRIFGHNKESAKSSKILAANQGLYNGFLAAGLFYGLYEGGPIGLQFKVFFLICISVAGLYGSYSAKKSILYIQACPAFLALALLYYS